MLTLPENVKWVRSTATATIHASPLPCCDCHVQTRSRNINKTCTLIFHCHDAINLPWMMNFLTSLNKKTLSLPCYPFSLLECLQSKQFLRINLQRILDEISYQVDDFERRYGRTDRRDFDGEFYVPPEVRNRLNNAKGSLRIHGGLLTMTRSRTFLTLTSHHRSSIHSSTPDLSRSVPSTPGSNHKFSLASSYDSVLEENENEGVVVIKKGKAKDKKSMKSVKHIFEQKPRRKSEDLLENSSRKSPARLDDLPTFEAVQLQQQHVRQSSDQAYRLIPRVKPHVDPRQSQDNLSIDEDYADDRAGNISRWGNFRGSNSFAANMNVGTISTYAIPRVSLSYHKIQLNEAENSNISSAESSQSSSNNNIPHRVTIRHNNRDDSQA